MLPITTPCGNHKPHILTPSLVCHYGCPSLGVCRGDCQVEPEEPECSLLGDDTIEFDPCHELAEEPAIDHGWEPTASDWADLREMQAESAARRHLDRRDLPLADLVRRASEFFAGFGSDSGDLIGETLAELAAAIESTGAASAAEFRARDEILREGR